MKICIIHHMHASTDNTYAPALHIKYALAAKNMQNINFHCERKSSGSATLTSSDF